MKLPIIALLIIIASCSKSAAHPEKVPLNEEPLVHEYIKLTLWLILGVIVGVFF